jgi:type VI secretion system protein ImpL
MGETGSAKTTTMVHCGLDAELLSGQMYEENNLLPTPTANLWFVKGSLFVETAGKLLGDPDSWRLLIKRLLPSKGAALIGAAKEAPRAALVCVDAETLLSPSPDALATSARKIRTQLGDISQLLGINLPVYVLFTRTDRVPFFTEYVSKLNDEEASGILGATLPIVAGRRGVYAEEETSRINGVFDRLFRAMCGARPKFLGRESNPEPLGGIYEFPREFRKIRPALVRFLVEVGRPSQLTVGPFLRGFYFSGVRPIMVNEVAPAPVQQESQAAAGRLGATSIFRTKSASASPAGQRIIGTRKVPQWLFLGHFFNDLLLADQVARGASASSVRASMPRRILLFTACTLGLAYSAVLVFSYTHNRTLETQVVRAAQGIASVDAAGMTAASLDSLQKLETLRQSLETLESYNRNGAPWSYRWGIYSGDALYPEVRSAYFANFRRLLLLQTQNAMVESLRGLPATPGPEYGPTYDTLKAYLITTSNHDKSIRQFLAPVLLNRWSANRNVDGERLQLAQKQFEFYSDELKNDNPYTADNDSAAIDKARRYLSQFAALERVYQAMLADAAKSGPAINFNKQFPGSAELVIDNQEVSAPFTKPGWAFMRAALKNPEKYFAGEAWVLGDQATSNMERSKMAQQLADRYNSDFVKAWRAYFKAAAVVKYASLPDAAKKLGVLSGNQSPLLALFWLASQNTAVDTPEVANAFQAPQVVVPPSSVDRYVAPSNQSYMNAMVTLQASVETVAAQPTGNDAAAAQTLTNATAAKVAARQVAQAFRIDPEAHVETTVQKLMEDPITNVEALLRTLGPSELNGKGKGLCTAVRAVMGKFPFNSAATPQATVADLNGVFHKPDGALWKFYDENLQKLLPRQGAQYVPTTAGGVTLNPAFVAFFTQAAGFSDFLYTGNSPDPHFTYTLKPVPAEGIQTVGLRLDGQAFSYSGGDAAPKQFVWQGGGAHEAKATVKFGGGPDLAWSTSEGLWAIFQFFNKAETWRPAGSGNVLEWVIRIGKDPVTLPSGKPLTVRFELDMGGGPQVFQKGYFNRLACVSEVAK